MEDKDKSVRQNDNWRTGFRLAKAMSAIKEAQVKLAEIADAFETKIRCSSAQKAAVDRVQDSRMRKRGSMEGQLTQKVVERPNRARSVYPLPRVRSDISLSILN